MLDQHYDVIIVGTGAGGGTLARKLADSGKKILMVERGQFLKREKENWDPEEVFHKERYHSKDTWYDKNDKTFQPGSHYFVGCLLYTSPSPRDLSTSRMPSSA